MFTGSLIIPYLIGGLRIAYSSPDIIFGQRVYKNKKNRIFYSFLIILTSPFHNAVLFLEKSYYELHFQKNPWDKELNVKWEKVKFHLNQHIRMELGLETLFQLAGQLILLFNSLTETGTYQGLDRIFRDGSEVTTLSLMLLTISSAFSFISCSTSNLQALASQREHFPATSKIMAVGYSLFACIVRILAFVMYFAPTLGLFNLLRHLQAEQTQWDPNIIKYFVYNGTIHLGNSSAIFWNQIDRWTISNDNLLPPHYTLYTYYTLLEYFYGFWIILLLQSICVYVVKKTCSVPFCKSNWLEKIIHVVENTHIPYNYMEWDAITIGGFEEHLKGMYQNKKEVVSVMIVNFLFNAILLLPMGNLGKPNRLNQ